MSGWRTAGYGSTLSELYRHDAPFVDKILKGAKPGDIPVEQPQVRSRH
jgi:putative tryptophan/tyrosine transport system substrate-binding protein